MKTVQLNATSREGNGKKLAKKIRSEQQVPCVMYGNGENLHFVVSEADLRPLIFTPNSYLVDININGKIEKAVIRELQFHPVTDNVLHVDFYRVEPKNPIQVVLPIHIVGNSEGVKLGGKLQIILRKLRVVGLLEHLPESLEVDITHVGLGKSIFVSDLSYPNLTITTPSGAVVCAVKMTRATRGAVAVAAAAAGKK